ncbi:peroxide stress protein YaaA [Acaryochloris sp. CCMEE 5410]|uniref:peroxide stress protein YaaA n=1 Tax=Acaryochloris sp. CCMEE 5410 TaxID=310037 RepID=UPI00024837FA|nr:peroxide stress protein YaaA [Acaryochloris sp. CCMEE 5410]KAI9133594.1 peroxide stress protein YaaA [Acaryochloris sp. CCMEE 5410]
MLMIISPSKTQNFDPPPAIDYTVPAQSVQTQTLVQQLRDYSPEELGKLMKISPKLSDLNWQRYQDFQDSFTQDNAKQALLAFKGDVYNGIEVDTYTSEDFSFAQTHLRILSGLYGLLKPLDLIQPYRLEMGTKLQTDKGKTLYDFWGTQITDALNADLDPEMTLVNLASGEYFKAIQPPHLKGKVLNIAFKENKNGTYKVIGIHAKRARGLMVNYAIQNRITAPERLQTFDVEGYAFNPSLSKDTEWAFCRD